MQQFDVLSDEMTVAKTVAALESHGFTVDVVDDLPAAREAVLARLPAGARVWRSSSVTLDQAGISAAVDAAEGPYASVRLELADRALTRRRKRELAAAPDFTLGSVQAITEAGELLIGSATGSTFEAIAWGAENVILVAGLQKVVPDLDEARRRLREHSLPMENVRAQDAYGQAGRLNKTLEIYRDRPGRIHLVLIRRVVGY